MDLRITLNRVLILVGIAALAVGALGLYACRTRPARRGAAAVPASWMPAIEHTTCAIDAATPGAEAFTARACPTKQHP